MMPYDSDDSETDSTMPSEQQPNVIDVQIPQHANIALPWLLSVLIFGLIIGFTLARRTGVAILLRTHPIVSGVVLSIAIIVCMGLTLLLCRPRIRTHTRHIVTRFKEKPIRDLVGHLFGNHGHVLQGTYLESMARGLALQGRVGVTIRSGPPKLATVIDPITVTFEPRLLDEEDASTVELQNALDSTTQVAATADTHKSLIDRFAIGRVKRNIRRAGGWFLFVVFVLQFISAVVESIETWRVTWHLVMWSLLLSTMMFGVSRSRLSNWRVQWLAVPGGIIIRKAGYRKRKLELHLFGRQSSVLVIHQRTRNLSYVCVADCESHQVGYATPGDVVFLLRAWLSPVPPPPLEQLTDWL